MRTSGPITNVGAKDATQFITLHLCGGMGTLDLHFFCTWRARFLSMTNLFAGMIA